MQFSLAYCRLKRKGLQIKELLINKWDLRTFLQQKISLTWNLNEVWLNWENHQGANEAVKTWNVVFQVNFLKSDGIQSNISTVQLSKKLFKLRSFCLECVVALFNKYLNFLQLFKRRRCKQFCKIASLEEFGFVRSKSSYVVTLNTFFCWQSLLQNSTRTHIVRQRVWR